MKNFVVIFEDNVCVGENKNLIYSTTFDALITARDERAVADKAILLIKDRFTGYLSYERLSKPPEKTSCTFWADSSGFIYAYEFEMEKNCFIYSGIHGIYEQKDKSEWEKFVVSQHSDKFVMNGFGIIR